MGLESFPLKHADFGLELREGAQAVSCSYCRKHLTITWRRWHGFMYYEKFGAGAVLSEGCQFFGPSMKIQQVSEAAERTTG